MSNTRCDTKCRVVDCRKKESKCKQKNVQPPCAHKGKPSGGGFLRKLGPKHISILSAFIPSLARYGTAALVFLVYMSEFKTVLQFLPFYNTKYKVEEKIIKNTEQNETEEANVAEEGKRKDC